ncbi:pentapeptide repeat-containing protein [Streptomyces phytohabitans]|uniref:pentapeptide repeat-containing protein n=1 Tax=Streptomyces phytohabitans TaxID=1150371 RepID=UPI00345BC54B
MAPYAACLAHLDDANRAAYLATLSPGADIDHRGTSITTKLLDALLAPLRDTSGRPHLGVARFDRATFTSDARFDGATFTSDAWFYKVTFTSDASFDGATFTSDARFDGATFTSDASFDGATFTSDAWFNGATFTSDAWFNGATFTSDAWFYGATFTSDASFYRATFTSDARFNGATFTSNASFYKVTFTSDAWFYGATFTSNAQFNEVTFTSDASFYRATFTSNAQFNEARFEGLSRLGPLVCGGSVVLDGAVFQKPLTVEVAARQVTCVRTQWVSTASLHLRYAGLDLRDAVFEYPVLVATRPEPFPRRAGETLPETVFGDADPTVRLRSMAGVDASHLALHDVDLSRCRFAGAVHLDQLRVDGWCTFGTTHSGWHRRFPWRWSQRNTLAEEHHWRVRTARASGRTADARGWTQPPHDAPELKPAAVAALYRQLRKSLEDGKNEPDAADMYYGECEMRRHDPRRPYGERALLTGYWAVSGYGLRAARALAWLLAAMAVTVAVMVLWGLPADDSKPETTGRQVRTGQDLRLVTDTPDPRNPTGPPHERVTSERFEKSLRVVINSVVFRSSGQELTTTGTYAEMASRLTEPVLLGLAALAIRSRVKR